MQFTHTDIYKNFKDGYTRLPDLKSP